MDRIKVGNAPCSWGTLEFSGSHAERLTYAEVLDQIAETGFEGSELGDWGFMPTDPEALSEEFRSRNLALTGAFVPVALRDPSALEPGLARCVKVATLLRDTSDLLPSGAEPFLVLADENGADPIRTRYAGRIEPSMALTNAEWNTFIYGANRIARAVLDSTGLRTVFHHHCAGFVETPDEIVRFLNSTDPSVVGLVFDTGHYAYGAGTCDGVVTAMERFDTRIWYVHFKDVQPEVMADVRHHGWDYFDAVRHGIFCEIGDGCVDFAGVLAWLERQQYTGYITVEQDVLPGMGTPLESARRDRSALLSIGL